MGGIRNFLAGYLYMACTGHSASVNLYPDPLSKDGSPPANTAYATTVQANSVFNDGTRDAILRSLVIHRDTPATAPLVTLYDWNGTVVHIFTPGGYADTPITEWNLRLKEGFYISVAGSPTITIGYQLANRG